MRKLTLLITISLMCMSSAIAQTIIATYPFTNYSQYNSFWGITLLNDTLRIGTDNNGSLYKVSLNGTILDSMTTPFTFNHGLAWDGSGFWIAQDFRTAGAKLYKVNAAGVGIDSIQLPSLIGGASGGVGDIAIDGNSLWFSIYSPDFTSYPYAYAYKIDLTSRLITDTIPLMGRQVQGITVKGDTVIYVNDYFHTTPFIDVERVYAYRKSTGDTLFSFPTPDPDGNCNPRGLHYDGRYLWLIAERVGGTAGTFKALYKYELTGAGNPQITTSANQIDFGNTIIGTPNDRTLSITNTGNAKLIISGLIISNPEYTITPNNVPDTLNPSQSKNYNVRFLPSAYGNTSSQLRILSNDGVVPEKIVNLYGKGIYNGSYISPAPAELNYSQRRKNSLSGGYINISNLGSQLLSLSSVSFNTQRFRLDTTGISFPVVIDTQKTIQFRIWFNPNSAANFTDTVKFNSNAMNNPQLKVFLYGTGTDNPAVLGDIMWQGNIPDNPNTAADNPKVVSMKEISDVNADGVNDVLISTDNYWTICYNGNSSVSDDILWKFNTRRSSNVSGSVVFEDGLQIMDDINGDGIKDVVVGTGGNNELVWALSGRTGVLLWTYGDSTIISDGDVNGVNVTKDFNGDGKKDVLIAASGEGEGNGRHAVICVNGVNGNVLFNVTQNAEFTHSAAPTSTGGAIDFSSNGGPYGINGFNNSGNQIWTYPIASTAWNLKEIPDINSDGQTDLAAFIGFGGTITTLSGVNGSMIWNINIGASIDGNIRLMQDLGADGFLDIVSSGPNVISRVDSRTAVQIWNNFLDGGYVHGVDELNDITGDGVNEIVCGTQNSNLYILTGDSGRTIFTYNFGSPTTNTVEQVSNLKSIDGNVSNEFIGGSRTGRVICFSGGPFGTVGISNLTQNIPEKYSLGQNYPNPFNPTSKITFEMPIKSKVILKVYDALGRELQLLINKELNAGKYEVEFSGLNYASGVYFYSIEAGNFNDVKRMILIK